MKTGYIALTGRTNSGKSTLINRLIREKPAIVSHKAQTTRRSMLYLYNDEQRQWVIFDTPGVFPKARNGLERFMLDEISRAMDQCEVVLFITSSGSMEELDGDWADCISGRPIVCLLNKCDLFDQSIVKDKVDFLRGTGRFKSVLPISALAGHGIPGIFEVLDELLPECDQPLYDPELISLERERDLVEEFIREALYQHLQDELPYVTGVSLQEMKSRENGMCVVQALIFCERDSQKRIIIGSGGQTLKRIGCAARLRIEEFLQNRVFLELRVKAYRDWRNRENMLKEFGYKPQRV
ncbi:MAG: GTPase Era [Candidatus Wallbacteria bacterium]|nr:GTPase Era [Candidatus Wallbacteria bacterium]